MVSMRVVVMRKLLVVMLVIGLVMCGASRADEKADKEKEKELERQFEEETKSWGPVLKATFTGNLETLKGLLKQLGAMEETDGISLFINEKEPKTEQTSLMVACLNGMGPMAEILLKHGADRTIGEQDGYTCLHGAAFQAHAEVVAAYVKIGEKKGWLNDETRESELNSYHSDGWTPMHRVVFGKGEDERKIETIKAFIEAGADPYVKDKNHGVTAKDLAANFKLEKVVAFFEEFEKKNATTEKEL